METSYKTSYEEAGESLMYKWMGSIIVLILGLIVLNVLPINSSALMEGHRPIEPDQMIAEQTDQIQLPPDKPVMQKLAASNEHPSKPAGQASPVALTTAPGSKSEPSHTAVTKQTPEPAPSKSPDAAGRSDEKRSELESTIQKWKSLLAKEKGFEDWEQASWSSYTLGPGTHGWVVILRHSGRDAGYMVIHAAENGGFRLTEYGLGEHPLFSMETLYRSLVQQELIPASITYDQFLNNSSISKQRWYKDPLNALWIVHIHQHTYFADAKTGEILPIDRLPDVGSSTEPASASRLTVSSDKQLLPAFDPYERLPWVQGKPLPVKQFTELKAALGKPAKLTLVAELFPDQTPVTVPLAIIGYQLWDKQEPYLIVDQEGRRYIPLTTAFDQGLIYGN